MKIAEVAIVNVSFRFLTIFFTQVSFILPTVVLFNLFILNVTKEFQQVGINAKDLSRLLSLLYL